MELTTEMHLRVYDDKSGEHFEIRPDRDGLDLVEIRDPSNDARIAMPPEMARAVARAMLRLADDIDPPAKRMERMMESFGRKPVVAPDGR